MYKRMGAEHEHTIKIQGAQSCQQIANNGCYIALPHVKNMIIVWDLRDLTLKPLELVGHSRRITALAFNKTGPPTYLCSCADDYVIVWSIEQLQDAAFYGKQLRGTVIGTTLGSIIQYCAYRHDNKQVAVCVDKDIQILNAAKENVIATLEGHNAKVTCAEYCPHYSATLVSISEDRTFKIWDISAMQLVYQSTIICASPFLSLTMNSSKEQFAVGSEDGQVRVYDLTDGNGFRLLHHIDASKVIRKLKLSKDSETSQESGDSGPIVVSSLPSWQKPKPSQSQEDTPEPFYEEEDVAILAMGYLKPADGSNSRKPPTPSNLPFLQRESSLLNDLLDTAPTLFIVTPTSILSFNAQTLEPRGYADLKDPIPSSSLLEGEEKILNILSTASMHQSPFQNKMCCTVNGLMSNEIHVLALTKPSDLEEKEIQSRMTINPSRASAPTDAPKVEEEVFDEGSEENALTVLSSGPLAPNSPLKSEMILKPKESPKPQKRGRTLKKSQSTDQPVTFNTKIKSSGYTEKPRTNMFKPDLGRTPTPKNLNFTRQRSASLPTSKSKPKEYPMDSVAPTILHLKMDVSDKPVAINHIQFSEDGKHLACSLTNTTSQVFKMPLTGKGLAFACHKGSVTSTSWSNDSQWLVTSSDDKSAALWSMKLPDPVMTFEWTNNNVGIDKDGGLKPTKANPLFSKPVKYAQFYYMDKFILLTTGNQIHLYKYHVDTVKSDIKRYLSNNRYKLVKTLDLSNGHQITAFSAVNSFYSYLSLAASSNKSLEIFDMNVAQSVRVIPDAHTKVTHNISQNKGSAYVSHPSSAYDLFVTAAAGDCIKMWDLRSNRVVRRYEGHSNRIYPCGVSISPCSKFIATGSEDRCAYIYDIRSGTYLHKITGHTDTVGTVSYHPLYPELLTASLDGKLRLFRDK